MLSYYLKCKNNTENEDLKVLKTKNVKTMLSSKLAACGSNKSRFMKEQEGSKLSSSPIVVPILGKILF